MIRLVCLVLLVFTTLCLFLNIGLYKIFVVLTELEAISKRALPDEFIEFANFIEDVTAQDENHSDAFSDKSVNGVAKTVSDVPIVSPSGAIFDRSTNKVEKPDPNSVIESHSDKNTNNVEKSISDLHMSRLVGKPTMWFPTRSNTNRPVQAQKRARSLKCRI